MFLSVIGRPECHDLGVGQIFKRQLGSSDDLDLGSAALAPDLSRGHAGGGVRAVDEPHRREQPGRARQRQCGSRRFRAVERNGCKRPNWTALEIVAWICNRQSCNGIEPIASFDQHRLCRVRRITQVG